jgi:hypothetical protein
MLRTPRSTRSRRLCSTEASDVRLTREQIARPVTHGLPRGTSVTWMATTTAAPVRTPALNAGASAGQRAGETHEHGAGHEQT